MSEKSLYEQERAAPRDAAAPVYERGTGRPPNARDAEAPGRTMPAGWRSHGAQGTTHDPNSTTTGTSAEPTGDVYPPKGEDPHRPLD